MVAVAGADVYVDGEYVGATDAYGKITIPGLRYGTHTIEVSKYGYYDASLTLEIPDPEGRTAFTITLRPVTVDITVTVSE